MFKNIIITLAALTCILTSVACVEDPTCHDPEGFQGEFGCVYDDEGNTTGLEELQTVEQEAGYGGRGFCVAPGVCAGGVPYNPIY